MTYAQAYSFKYSPRPGTPAAEAENQVDEAVKAARLQTIQALISSQQSAFNDAQMGKTLPILFDKPSKHAGQITGRSPYLQPVHVKVPEGQDGEALFAAVRGRILPVEITRTHRNSLSGQLADSFR